MRLCETCGDPFAPRFDQYSICTNNVQTLYYAADAMAQIDRERFDAAYRGLYGQAVRTAQSVLGDTAAAEDASPPLGRAKPRTRAGLRKGRGGRGPESAGRARPACPRRWRTIPGATN